MTDTALSVLGSADQPLRPKPDRIGSGKGFKRAMAAWREARRARVLFLFSRGMSGQQIAAQVSDECGSTVTPRTATRDIRAGLDQSRHLDDETVERERATDLARCDGLIGVWLPIASDPDSKRAKLASEIVHRCMIRRGKLLKLDHAAMGSGTSVAVQVNTAAAPPVHPDIDFSTWSDTEVIAFRFLTQKAQGLSPAGSLDEIVSRKSRIVAPVILVDAA